ncbi:MAG: DNA repair protein RecN [Anaerolineae bacterium]|nr:MAG: DNA repair protein RecN [Anaerolineae bacterium]
MLAELVINDFAIIDDLRIQFLPGFNVLTGETGAGKSIILDAMALVLGERADTTMIRTGSDSAYVEATFSTASQMDDALKEVLAKEALDNGDQYLTLAREIRANGRNISRVNGRIVNLNILRGIGGMLVDIHGQGEHLTLLQPRSHKYLLDGYGTLDEERSRLAEEVNRLLKIRKELAGLRRDERELAQRRDLLHYQVAEITAANLVLKEEDELRDERIRLSNAESLIEHSAEALRVIDDAHNNSSSVNDLLGQAQQSINQLVKLDRSMEDVLDQLNNLNYQLSDIVAELLSYRDKLEFNPGRLSFVEERLELISQLKRKYGDSIEEVLAWSDHAALELERIENSEERIVELENLEDIALHKVGKFAKKLSEKRKAAAARLARVIEEELTELNMEQANFRVDFSWTEDPNGVYVNDQRLAFDQSGVDSVEFLLSTNPGESLKPVAKVASGGETSRLMLALKSVLAQVDKTPTLIFDEIDQGIGGRIGDIVGRKLWGLTHPNRHQVIVVTHLPQLAGYADGHYCVSKSLADGRTITSVNILDQDGRIEELASMLGTQGQIATGGAESILDRVEEFKKGSSLN